MTNINIKNLLDFDSPNKTASLICKKVYGLPFHVQKYIEDNQDSEETKDLTSFFTKAWQETKPIDKRSDKFDGCKRFWGRICRIKKGNQTTEYNFSDEQIEKVLTMGTHWKPNEIIRQILPNEVTDKNGGIIKGKLDGLSRHVAALLDSQGIVWEGEMPFINQMEMLETETYRPPPNDEVTLAKINEANPVVKWTKSGMDSHQRLCLQVLKENLHLPRFQVTINGFRKAYERKLFESEFIRATFDKPDLTSSDINSYFTLCSEYIRESQINEVLNLLNERLHSTIAGDIGQQTSMLKEMDSKTKELKDCRDQMHKLKGALEKHRSARKEDELKKRESIVSIVERVMDAATRENFVKEAKAYKEYLAKEISEFEEVDQSVGEIHGISFGELIGFRHVIRK